MLLRLSLHLCSRSHTFLLHISSLSLLDYQIALLKCIFLKRTLICPVLQFHSSVSLLNLFQLMFPLLFTIALNVVMSKSPRTLTLFVWSATLETMNSSHFLEALSSLGFKETTLSWFSFYIHWLLIFNFLYCWFLLFLPLNVGETSFSCYVSSPFFLC